MTEYIFKLRHDLPNGFQRNSVYPELPATTEYLASLNGRKYSSIEDFKKATEGYTKFLERKKITIGDKATLSGIIIKENSYSKKDYFVGLLNSNLPICPFTSFGRLEKIIN